MSAMAPLVATPELANRLSYRGNRDHPYGEDTPVTAPGAPRARRGDRPGARQASCREAGAVSPSCSEAAVRSLARHRLGWPLVLRAVGGGRTRDLGAIGLNPCSIRMPSYGGSQAITPCHRQPTPPLPMRATPCSPAPRPHGRSRRSSAAASCRAWRRSSRIWPPCSKHRVSSRCRFRSSTALIAQAMHDGMVLVSNEESFSAYGMRRLW
jgi:hypothetical protein